SDQLDQVPRVSPGMETRSAKFEARCMRPSSVGLLCALASLWLVASPVRAEEPRASNPNIAFDYYEPRDPAFMPLYEKLQKREVLEELSQFLAPVHWPKKLRLIMKQCPPARSDIPQMSELIFYNSAEYSLTVCYQLFPFLEQLNPPPTLATPQEAV